MQAGVSIADYWVQPLVSRMSADENAVHERVMQRLMASGRPYDLRDAPDADVVRDLAARNVLALADDAVVAAYPVSARPTNKRVIFADGREAYAMCALDAIGFHYVFGEDIRIESACEACGEPIVLAVRDGRIEALAGGDDIHILHADLQNSRNWACSCCTIMHFFSCNQQLNDWREQHAADVRAFPLDLETANKMAWLLFAR